MNVRRMILLIAVGVIILALIGCDSSEMPINIPRKEFQHLWYSKELSENYYTWKRLRTRKGIKGIEIDMNVIEAPSYGIEVWLMNEAQFLNFRSGGPVNVEWHWTVYEGKHTLTFNSLKPYKTYYVVVDNTDFGWVETDFDGEDDYAYFNAEIYFIYY